PPHPPTRHPSPTRRSSDLHLLRRPPHPAMASEPADGHEQQVVQEAGARRGAQQHQPELQDVLPRQEAADNHRRLTLERGAQEDPDRKSTRLNSSHVKISYA